LLELVARVGGAATTDAPNTWYFCVNLFQIYFSVI